MNKVYWTDMQCGPGNSLEDKLRRLLTIARLDSLIGSGELVAVKIHSGERGNTAFISHLFARVIALEISACGGKPFLTDTNTLYSGGRHHAVDHIETATMHGFSSATAAAPFIVADGLRGLDCNDIAVDGTRIRKARIASAIAQADRLVMLSHFKGHCDVGFGGCIKNLGMGCAGVPGKLEQHSSSKPLIDNQKCVACGQCLRACPAGAITMTGGSALIDYAVCIGCGQCVASCGYAAAQVKWGESQRELVEKMADYASAVHNRFLGKALYLNFAMGITPDCDCWGHSAVPVVPDCGILASHNPAAVDRAALDMVNKAARNAGAQGASDTSDLFDAIHDGVQCEFVFESCRKLGMDESYELVQVD